MTREKNPRMKGSKRKGAGKEKKKERIKGRKEGRKQIKQERR